MASQFATVGPRHSAEPPTLLHQPRLTRRDQVTGCGSGTRRESCWTRTGAIVRLKATDRWLVSR